MDALRIPWLVSGTRQQNYPAGGVTLNRWGRIVSTSFATHPNQMGDEMTGHFLEGGGQRYELLPLPWGGGQD